MAIMIINRDSNDSNSTEFLQRVHYSLSFYMDFTESSQQNSEVGQVSTLQSRRSER